MSLNAKEEMWVRTQVLLEKKQPAIEQQLQQAHRAGIEEGKKQAAREIVEIISSTNFWANHFDLSTYHALQTHLELLISEKFKLEG